jgi:hypothetical protein
MAILRLSVPSGKDDLIGAPWWDSNPRPTDYESVALTA